MSDLTPIEKRKLEMFLQMGGGYVLSFSNRTFAEFVLSSTGRDIEDEKYDYASCSKANRMRKFWSIESNYIVAKLIEDLLEYAKPSDPESDEGQLYDDCHRIVNRLKQSSPVPDIEAISPNADGKDFEVLAKSVRESIERNEPELGLDRLHTFVMKYIRVLCNKHGISAERDKPLHAIVGEYAKHLRQQGLIESEMTERILKSSISIMEAFNRVRNKQSLAHDNPILNYDESLLIFNHIASAIRFLGALEVQTPSIDENESNDTDAGFGLPF
jgi:hypothetical protein